MNDAVTSERWRRAQESEQQYWDGLDVTELLRICAEKPAFLKYLDADILAALFDGREILEIGCGPLGVGLASFYPGKAAIRRLVKVEPLPRVAVSATGAAREPWAAPFVAWVAGLADEGEYVQMPGEALDFEADFDTVVTYNVLDHVQAPGQILGAACRALRPGGRILVGVDCLSVVGRLRFEHLTRRRLAGSILVEAHPHTFLPDHVIAMMAAAGFAGLSCRGLPGRLRRIAGSGYRPAFLGEKR